MSTMNRDSTHRSARSRDHFVIMAARLWNSEASDLR